MFLVINKFGIHSTKPPFERYEDAYRYAERLNCLRNLGWRVVEIYAGRGYSGRRAGGRFACQCAVFRKNSCVEIIILELIIYI